VDCLDEALAVDLARESLYRFLAAALGDPREPRWQLLLDPANRQLAREAAGLLRGEAALEPIPRGFGELPPDQLDLSRLLAELSRSRAELAAEYDRVFGLVPARECPPYETEYHTTAEPFFRAQQLADVAGFYRAFGLETSRTAPERPDHLPLELEFLAFLLLKRRLAALAAVPDSAEQIAICDEVFQNFFREHLSWWVPSFTVGLRRKAGGGFYAAAADVLAALLPAERARLNVPAPRQPLKPAPIERPEEQPECGGCAAQA
jgi:TorA maturation chaperone TorD